MITSFSLKPEAEIITIDEPIVSRAVPAAVEIICPVCKGNKVVPVDLSCGEYGAHPEYMGCTNCNATGLSPSPGEG